MKKILLWILLSTFLLPFYSYTFAESCSLTVLETKTIQNKSINSFQNYLYSYYIQEKKYIWSDSGKRDTLSCKLNTSFTNLNNVYSTLERLDQYIQVRDKKSFDLQTLKLQSQIKSFVISMNEYRRDKVNYEKLLLTKKDTVTWYESPIKIDTTTPSDPIDSNTSSTTTVSEDWIVNFNSKQDIFKRFSYNWKDSFLQTNSSWVIEYYLVDSKSQIDLLISQKSLDKTKSLSFYLSQEKKYWVIDLRKHPIKDYLTFEVLKTKFGLYVDNLTYTVKWETKTETLTSLIQLYGVTLTINWKTWVIGNQITKAYSFNSRDSLELYFQSYANNEDLLKDFLVARIWDSYYTVKVKTLEQATLAKLWNNLTWSDSQKDLFVKLDSFKNESFDTLTFTTTDNEWNDLEIKRDPVFTWVSNVFIAYTDSSNYVTQLQDYQKNYTTLSFWTDSTLYYNKVDNMKQLLKDKLGELSTYQYYADNIKNSTLSKWIFNTAALSWEDETIFKTYKWIAENITYDEKTKNDVIKLSQSWELTWQVSLDSNKSHYWIYTLKNKLWVCDWISILFADLLKINGVSAKIVTWKDNQSWIWHALILVWSSYYDPTNEITKMKSLNQKTLMKWTEAFYKMPETQLKTYFTEIKTKEESDNFSINWTWVFRNSIIENIKTILDANPWYVLYTLWVKDKWLTSETKLTDVTEWSTEFAKTDTIYKWEYFENIKSKPVWVEYIPFSGKKQESLKAYFIYAYLQWYKYYYYHPTYNEIQFYKSK